jgi:hypothetical protein
MTCHLLKLILLVCIWNISAADVFLNSAKSVESSELSERNAADESIVVGPADAPWAETYLSRRRQLSSTEEVLYVGELRHDVSRRRHLTEDFSLPIPIQIHSLGHNGRYVEEEGGDEIQNRRALRNRNLADGVKTTLPAVLTPLYQGYGTHYSYVYIGTPPQRQSVIVDTGSHYTAFPCTGCSQCGQHTDNYWDPNASSTKEVLKCSNDLCNFGQSYSEGSSWRAYKVKDQLWVGGQDADTVPTGNKYAVNFMFGCQTSETGLFRTQLADGIMGMAMAIDTLPSQLVEQKVAKSNIFAMCFRVGGGIMTIGGVDQRIHTKSGVLYAKIRETDGWYTVSLLDVQLQNQGSSRSKTSLGFDKNVYNSGKGPIVDSGTTDTYLPQQVKAQFTKVFEDLSGKPFSSGNIKLSDAELAKMPDVVFTLEGTDGKPFDVVMPFTNYIDKVGDQTYAFRIYLTEGQGAVLGANFMNGYNVIFDKANRRVGFARSDCMYEEYREKVHDVVPTMAPSVSADSGAPVTDCSTHLTAIKECTARCNLSEEGESHTYTKEGIQEYHDSCPQPKTVTKPCTIPCNGNKIVRGVDTCPEKPWNPCLKSCIQSRDMPLADELSNKVCKYAQQTRACYSGDCPMQDGDMLIFIDMRVGIQPSLFSYAFTEAFYGALAKIFNVHVQNIELLNDARNEYFLQAKLHFQIRLKAKDYATKQELVNAAQAIPVICWKQNFGQMLISTLDSVSKSMDHLDYSRYNYLDSKDVEVLNAVALPIGEVRAPIDVPVANEDPTIASTIKDAFVGREIYFFVGVGIAVMCIVGCVFYLYLRLHRETMALTKERLERTSLMKMLRKMKNWKDGANVEYDEDGNMYSEVEMGDVSERGGGGVSNPIHSPDDEDDDINLEFSRA